MPHIVVKLWPGRTEKQKKKLTKLIVEDVVETLEVKRSSISVGFEEIPQEEWVEKVYNIDINNKNKSLYKKPGYKPEDIDKK